MSLCDNSGISIKLLDAEFEDLVPHPSVLLEDQRLLIDFY